MEEPAVVKLGGGGRACFKGLHGGGQRVRVRVRASGGSGAHSRLIDGRFAGASAHTGSIGHRCFTLKRKMSSDGYHLLSLSLSCALSHTKGKCSSQKVKARATGI